MDQEFNMHFKDMGLDERILEAITDLNWKEPTLIQEKAIPLALEGKDILARARTGSGKTAAFIIPIIQHILHQKSIERAVNVLVLAPSTELCKQIYGNIRELSSHCSKEVTCVDISPQVDLIAQRPMLLEKPCIVVGTPTRVLAHLKENNLCIRDTLQILVIDEADLLFSHGCEKDVCAILEHLPSIYQAFLMSATLNQEVKQMKKLLLHNPVVLKLKEPDLPDSSQLTQYHIKCEDEDKFVLIYALFKLHLIQGKSLIFVNTVDRCYRLKLFLEQFGINNCVLNSELPATSRCHAVTQFNAGTYEIVIASDEQIADNPGATAGKRKKDKDYSIARGIDFQFVSNVINFDFPKTIDAYIHRVGRTARGNAEGTALSFVNRREMAFLTEIDVYFSQRFGEDKATFKPYLFRMEELEGFKYRAHDAYRAVTKAAVREARLKEIKAELLNSRALKSYFEDNPRDHQVLRHDKSLHIVKLDSHLKNVPDYIIPSTLKSLYDSEREKRRQRKSKLEQNKPIKLRESKSRKKFRRDQKDPLKSFKFEGLTELDKKKKNNLH